MFLLNSRLGLFTATLLRGCSFSRSYGTILPNSLAAAHPSALGCSPRLSVSISGTDCLNLALEVFLGSMIRCTISSAEASEYCCVSAPTADFPAIGIPTHFNELFRQFAVLTRLRPRIAVGTGVRILTDLPSASPVGLSLGPDLP